MKQICAALALLLMTSGSMAETDMPLCVLDASEMPESWRPSGERYKGLPSGPWTARESEEALYSIRKGVDEMIDLYDIYPKAIFELWEDSIGSLIEVSYSSANDPALDRKLHEASRHNLVKLIEPYLDREPGSMSCNEFEDVLPFTLYTHKLLDEGDDRTETMIGLANAAFQSCDSLSDSMGIDYKALFADPAANHMEVFDLIIWSLLFIEAELVPGLELPEESRQFSPDFWTYLETYKIKGADDYDEGPWDDEFPDMAYLATHIAYIPTGNHRFPLYIEDSPGLYRYLRENFYPSLDMGELDLVAELVDTFRQYGCTAENDLQTRDGTRYLLEVFRNGDERWMRYREEGETDADVNSYDLVHKAWTGVLGVRVRNIEPAEAGTYGGVVRRWLPAPQ